MCRTVSPAGCPIRKSADQFVFANHRSLSQLITSFVASESQGIRHAPLLTFLLMHILTEACASFYYEQKTYSFISLLVNFNMSKIVSFLRRLTVFEHFQNPHGRRTVKNPSPKRRDGVSQNHPIVVENIGIEPMTPCLQGRCSSQLS